MAHGRGVADQAGSFPWGSERSQAPQSSSAVDSADSLSRLRRGRREKLPLPQSSQGGRTHTLEPAEHSCSERPERGVRCSASSCAVGLQSSRKKLPELQLPTAASSRALPSLAQAHAHAAQVVPALGAPAALHLGAAPKHDLPRVLRFLEGTDPSPLPACRVSRPARSCDHPTSGSEEQKRHESWQPNTGVAQEGGLCRPVRQSPRSLRRDGREPMHLPA